MKLTIWNGTTEDTQDGTCFVLKSQLHVWMQDILLYACTVKFCIIWKCMLTKVKNTVWSSATMWHTDPHICILWLWLHLQVYAPCLGHSMFVKPILEHTCSEPNPQRAVTVSRQGIHHATQAVWLLGLPHNYQFVTVETESVCTTHYRHPNEEYSVDKLHLTCQGAFWYWWII